MKILSLVTQKGGTGKTTLAASLAVMAQNAGEKVLAVDLDPQGSLATWGELREADTPHVERLPSGKIASLPQTLAAIGKQNGFTLAILDTAGADNPTTHAAMQAADLCLVPLRPTRLDANAVTPTVQALMRLGTPFAFVLTQTPTGRSNPRVQEMAAGLNSLGILANPPIGARADHQDAYATGLGVSEFAPDGKAAEEVAALWAWVSKRMKGLKA